MKRALILLIAAVIVTGGLVTFVLLRNRDSVTPANTNTTNTPTTDATNAPVVRDESPEAKDQANLKATATLVTERLGSFSSTTVNLVVPEIVDYLTATGQAEAEGIMVAERQKYLSASDSVGVSTRARALNVTRFVADSSATVEVQTLREETVTGAESTQRQQTLRLELVKTDDTWKVNRLAWL